MVNGLSNPYYKPQVMQPQRPIGPGRAGMSPQGVGPAIPGKMDRLMAAQQPQRPGMTPSQGPGVPPRPGMGMMQRPRPSPEHQQQQLVSGMMKVAFRNPKSVRLILEEKMKMTQYQIENLYKMMLERLESGRPEQKASVAGLMEKNYGKSQNFVSEYNPAPATTGVSSEPGDVTAGWPTTPT